MRRPRLWKPEDGAMDAFLFIALPYMALVLAIGVGIYRYVTNRYTYSSLSSQILENRKLFWGSVPWHYGITLDSPGAPVRGAVSRSSRHGFSAARCGGSCWN